MLIVDEYGASKHCPRCRSKTTQTKIKGTRIFQCTNSECKANIKEKENDQSSAKGKEKVTEDQKKSDVPFTFNKDLAASILFFQVFCCEMMFGVRPAALRPRNWDDDSNKTDVNESSKRGRKVSGCWNCNTVCFLTLPIEEGYTRARSRTQQRKV